MNEFLKLDFPPLIHFTHRMATVVWARRGFWRRRLSAVYEVIARSLQ